MATENGASTDATGSRAVDEMVTALNAANRDFIGATTETEVASVLSEAARDVLEFAGTGVRLYEPEENALVHQAFGGKVNDIETRPPYDVDSSPHGRAFTRCETVVDDIGETDPYDREPFDQTMYVPVGEYGILSAGKTDGRFTETEVRIAETLARNARVAFDKAVEQRDLERSLDRLENQKERLEHLSRTLTHDIRNPLNVAQGNVAMLQQRYDDDRLDNVERTVDRMGQLVDDVLTLLSERQTVEKRERVVLGRLANRCWNAVQTDEATLTLERDAALDADPSRLRHVFENLFRNAVEHGAPEQQGTADEYEESLTVWVGASANCVYVEDDGPGIPEERHDQVFESGYTTIRGGTGFGLSIVSDMVEAHGWEVSVTEGRTGGAKFAISGLDAVNERH